MSDDCIFCAIVDGDIPNWTLHEDEDVLAFLDVNPVSEGHALVIPKAHHERLTDMDAETTSTVFNTAREIARAMETALDPDGFTLHQANGEAAGQEVFHSHVHIIPRTAGDDIDFHWEPGDLEDDTAQQLQGAIQNAL